jgi:hypothetical protein
MVFGFKYIHILIKSIHIYSPIRTESSSEAEIHVGTFGHVAN